MLRQTLISGLVTTGMSGAVLAQDTPVPGTAYYELHSAYNQMALNVKQFEALEKFQDQLMAGEDETLLNRQVPHGLCIEGMEQLCALFPATFGTWEQGGE